MPAETKTVQVINQLGPVNELLLGGALKVPGFAGVGFLHQYRDVRGPVVLKTAAIDKVELLAAHDLDGRGIPRGAVGAGIVMITKFVTRVEEIMLVCELNEIPLSLEQITQDVREFQHLDWDRPELAGRSETNLVWPTAFGMFFSTLVRVEAAPLGLAPRNNTVGRVQRTQLSEELQEVMRRLAQEWEQTRDTLPLQPRLLIDA